MQATTMEMIRRYDRPGPRYTSYPTALEFHPEVDHAAYVRYLEQAGTRSAPLSFYIHLPFCEERCLFCGCNVVVTKQREIATHYLEVLAQEVRHLAGHLGERRALSQYHWGGGTPTYLSTDQMRALQGVVKEHFEIEPDAEVAIEVDPRVTTQEHLEVLCELGFNRLSVGVQDFDPEVQAEVHRIQPFELTQQLLAAGRALGFTSSNVDLIYGLPLQKPESFRETIKDVIRIKPERIAIYSYAHVPWMKGHQRKIREETLPTPETKLELFTSAVSLLQGAGYVSIGMDHFALPDDELGRASLDGTLGRNFMGYTVRQAPDMVACGLSGIGDVEGAYFQNERKLHSYQRAVEERGLAVERGYVRTDDDHVRRFVIGTLMCAFRLDFADVEDRFGIRFGETFRQELEDLKPMAADGLVDVTDTGVQVTDEGRLFIRNVCMTFDAYLRRSSDDTPRWSRTV
ncbi:MAG: oxygen-independent coproporphyrinogen III oxidase [Planctomycetota bacterium]|jgi:oxygen-independent coproporphyrinogen-3 oxidase